METPDYYAILGLEPSCTGKDVKRAFREKAKQFHPDLTGGDAAKTATMRRLLTAYEVLSSAVKRREYDARFRVRLKDYVFDYREFLKKNADDPEMQAKLIFFDLLHGEEEEAVAVFYRLFAADLGLLRKQLDREDFMDGGFLLAEALEERERYLDAFRILKEIALMEREEPYFRHFFVEVTDKIRHIVRERLPRAVSRDVYISVLEEMIALNLSRRENATQYRHIAQILAGAGDVEQARVYLRKALACDRYLTGIDALKRRIGYVD